MADPSMDPRRRQGLRPYGESLNTSAYPGRYVGSEQHDMRPQHEVPMRPRGNDGPVDHVPPRPRGDDFRRNHRGGGRGRGNRGGGGKRQQIDPLPVVREGGYDRGTASYDRGVGGYYDAKLFYDSRSQKAMGRREMGRAMHQQDICEEVEDVTPEALAEAKAKITENPITIPHCMETPLENAWD